MSALGLRLVCTLYCVSVMSEYVLLGEADAAIGSEKASWATNKIGGIAVSLIFLR